MAEYSERTHRQLTPRAVDQRTIGVHAPQDPVYERGLVGLLSEEGLAVSAWGPSGNPGPDVWILVFDHQSWCESSTEVRSSGARPVVLVDPPIEESTRSALERGRCSVVPKDSSVPTLMAVVRMLLVDEMTIDVVPEGVSRLMAQRLERPPDELDDSAKRFLAYLSKLSIEESGAQLGYSRRQAQRRFKSLCDRFGLTDHLEAAVAATRWGLLRAPQGNR